MPWLLRRAQLILTKKSTNRKNKYDLKNKSVIIIKQGQKFFNTSYPLPLDLGGVVTDRTI